MSLRKAFPIDHPAAVGHFPGNPIIPGAVLLSETLRLIEVDLGQSLSPYRVRRAKFPHPVRPGDELRIQFTGSAHSAIRFECAVRDTTVLAGEIECCASSTP